MQEVHYENYGPYVQLVQDGYIEININDITPENYNYHFDGLLNIMRDGIEDPYIQGLKIGLYLADGNFVKFTLTDYWFNLIPFFITNIN